MRAHIRMIAGFLMLAILLSALPAWSKSKPRVGPDRPKLGVALSGGGARGLAHIGVLKVMEEAGLHPDFITGTSMGSVVGALYASGYTAAQIETMVLSMDWAALLHDKVSRNDRSVQNKQDMGKYQLTFPVQSGQISLPAGLVSGQNVTLLLSHLLFQERDIHDFHQLPIPFECMATDIVTGQDVVLDRGDLVQAVRTSMAIPSVFTPVEWEGRLLVDGGVSRNLPVSNLFVMGADLVIAVDVNAFLLPREKLNNFTAIFDQSQTITSRPASVAQAAKSQLVIEPAVVDFSIASFEQAQEIIARGEAAARAKFPELQALARQLGHTISPALHRKPMPELETEFIQLSGIQIRGLQAVPESFVKEQLLLDPNARVSLGQIGDGVKRLYGSGYFRNVRYQFQPTAAGETLIVEVVENLHSNLRFGLHYDSELKAMLLINGNFQNVLLPDAALSLDAYLGPYGVYRGSYLFHPNWRGDVSLGLRARYEDGSLSVYDQDQVKAYANQKFWQLDLITQSSLANVMVYGVGVQKEILFLSGITPNELAAQNLATTESMNALAYVRLDTLDDAYYPESGTLLELTGKWLTDFGTFYGTPGFVPFGQVSFQASESIPLAERFTLALGASGAGTFGPPANQTGNFFVGGMTSLERHRFSFLGTRFIQRTAPDVALGQIGLQWEMLKSVYLLLRGNVGWTGAELNEVFQRGALMTGYGATLGILTPIGPLEGTVMSSSLENGLAGFVNLGYRF